MTTGSKIKIGAKWAGLAFLVLIGWCAVMVAYFGIYGAFEDNAVPVGFGSTKEFSASLWDQGYFHAKGTYKNNSAIEDGDEMVPQVDDITCVKQTNTCTIAVADVFDHFLNVDVTNYDIELWNEKQITFSEDSAVCATSNFTVDRGSESFNLMVRKKAAIPDYAQNSMLHPCDNLKDKNITLADGFPVYWHLRERFEQRNGLYFHALLLIINGLYFGALFLVWRRRHPRRTAEFVPTV